MPSSINPREPLWHPAAQVTRKLPATLGPWLTDQGSLTARLITHSEQQFSVKLLRQGWGRAHPSELCLLGISARHKLLVREVILLGRGENWVFARSLIPFSSLQGKLKALRNLDNRPLGAFLFQDPNMSREPIEVASINACHHYVDDRYLSAQDGQVWGRRSLFRLQQQPLLVSEVFLPAFMASL